MRVGRLAAAETTARGQLGAEDLLVSLGKPEQEIQGTLPRGTTSDCKVCCTIEDHKI